MFPSTCIERASLLVNNKIKEIYDLNEKSAKSIPMLNSVFYNLIQSSKKKCNMLVSSPIPESVCKHTPTIHVSPNRWSATDGRFSVRTARTQPAPMEQQPSQTC